MFLEPIDKLEISELKNYLIAIEGVLMRGDQMIRGADRFIQRLHEGGINFLLLTNNSRRTPEDLAFNLQNAGLPVQARNIFTSAMATARYLHSQKPGGSAYVIGESGLVSALEKFNYVITDQDPDYVVLGGTDHYDYDLIVRAVNLILNGAHFICTNPEPSGGTQDDLSPASGAMAALIEKAAGASPFFIGKPNPLMMRSALNYLGIHSEDTVMIGDRMDTDIIAGVESGMQTILVLTGDNRIEDAARSAYRPAYIVRSVVDVFPLPGPVKKAGHN